MESYLSKISVRHRVRDPLYGFIYLTDAEKRIVDTPIFQRLRRIHQLALTNYVYPSAEHSRFVHSLGVMHCATLILAGVFSNKNSSLKQREHASTWEIKTLRFASLLHDIGHLPFSHAAEQQWLHGLKHENLSQYIITNHVPIREILEEEGVEPAAVASLLTKTPSAKLRLLHEIVSGQLDADRADYLLRDSHFCGVKYGEYDFHRFLNIFAASDDNDMGHLVLSVDEADLHVAESILIARYHYNIQIPYHRTRSGFDFILQRFLQDFADFQSPFTIEGGQLLNVDFAALEDLDDYTIMEHVKKARRNDNVWANYLLRQKHLIPAIDTSNTSDRGTIIFKELVRTLKKTDTLKENDDYFVQDQEIELLKWTVPADSNEHDENPPLSTNIRLLSKEGKSRKPAYVDIHRRSWIFERLTKTPYRICRVYVTPEKIAEVRAILQAVEIAHQGESHE